MRNIKAIFTKQLKSFFKNPSLFGTPASFLLIPFLMLMLTDAGDARAIIVSQFVLMFAGISMIGNASYIITEDRSTMNLRFMGMAGVKPWQYLIATSGVFLMVSLGVLYLFGLMAGFSGEVMINFLILCMLGIVCSILLGTTLGLSKFAPFTMIIALVLGIGPIFAVANEALANMFRFTFVQQMNIFIRQTGGTILEMPDGTVQVIEGVAAIPEGMLQIMAINVAVLLVLFIVTNLRNGLDGERLAKKRG
ncbi:MAG: hypothetical protein FWE04_01185 [Oscillospiraceae bacterium]|nr:hypothetical protein [Oscillospiraceae bacterium]